MASYKEMIEFLVRNNVSGICKDRYDCSLPDQECCMSQCVGNNNCFGYECSLDSQCGLSETCCRGTCAGHCDSLLPLILGCVFTALFLICVIAAIAWLCKRRLSQRCHLRKRLLAHNESRVGRANQRQIYYGGTQHSSVPPCTCQQGNLQSNISQYGPVTGNCPIPNQSRYSGQRVQSASERGAAVMTTDQPPPYSSYDQRIPKSTDIEKGQIPILNTGERAAPSAPSLLNLTLP